ncbi:histidine phosphatase family protein [Leptospira inadai]|nr:histidine phosphatase family protein [Leptospira inadai]PNV71929.1 histidine phosphatase family protein [Leptospira inadai serovar Lyme]
MKRSLFLIRHPRTIDNNKRCFPGNDDISLSPEGKLEAKRLGVKLSRYLSEKETVFFVSPSISCTDTWQNMGLSEKNSATLLRELEELNFGIWKSRSFGEIHRLFPDDFRRFSEFDPALEFPAGEQISSFLKRISQVKDLVLNELSSGSDIVLISHGGVLSVLICILLGLAPVEYTKFRIFSGSISTLEIYRNGTASLTGLNRCGRYSEDKWPV